MLSTLSVHAIPAPAAAFHSLTSRSAASERSAVTHVVCFTFIKSPKHQSISIYTKLTIQTYKHISTHNRVFRE